MGVVLWCYCCGQLDSVCQGLLKEDIKKPEQTPRIVSLGAEEAGIFSNTLLSLRSIPVPLGTFGLPLIQPEEHIFPTRKIPQRTKRCWGLKEMSDGDFPNHLRGQGPTNWLQIG